MDEERKGFVKVKGGERPLKAESPGVSEIFSKNAPGGSNHRCLHDLLRESHLLADITHGDQPGL